jgi:hypothetical protein
VQSVAVGDILMHKMAGLTAWPVEVVSIARITE